MSEEDFFTSYADEKKRLKKMKVTDIGKRERAWIIMHEHTAQRAIKAFFIIGVFLLR